MEEILKDILLFLLKNSAALFTVSGRPAATLEMFPSWPMRFQVDLLAFLLLLTISWYFLGLTQFSKLLLWSWVFIGFVFWGVNNGLGLGSREVQRQEVVGKKVQIQDQK